MRRQMRKVFALVLCAALALCMAGPAGAPDVLKAAVVMWLHINLF